MDNNSQQTFLDEKSNEIGAADTQANEENLTTAEVNSLNDDSEEAQAPLQSGSDQDDLLSAEKNSLVENLGFSQPNETNNINEFQLPEPILCRTASDVAQSSSVPSLAKVCERISNRLASVSMSDCEEAKLGLTQCLSVSDFPIVLREFAPIEGRSPLGRILVIGGTHGDELTSVSIVFRWIEKLNRFHSGLFHWHIAPMINPDGVLKSHATRTNQNAVDLNRNLPSDDWEQNALKYWAEKSGKNKRRYPGPHAASEPETKWLLNEINTFKPDAIISVHAPYGVVDYDSLLLNAAPKSLGKLALNLLGTYPGSLGNYAGINRNIPVITLELPHAWVMPSEQETTKIWEDIVAWLRKNVNSAEPTETPTETPTE